MLRTWTIGSDPTCDVVVGLPQVSGRHCRLTEQDGDFLLEDLASTNGTFLNGERVAGLTRVTPADAIRLGVSTPMPWPAEASVSSRSEFLTIGREADNDVVIDLPMVSGHHARLVHDRAGGGAAVLEDLGSANGTAIGSPDLKVTRSPLAESDTVFLGSHPIPAAYLLARLDPTAASTLALDAVELVLGRDPDCGRVVDLPMVSGRHAMLRRTEGHVWIEDLGSTNGTYVDGRRIEGRVSIGDGAWIGLGSHTLRLAVGTTTPSIEVGPSPDPGPVRPLLLLALFAQALVVAGAIAATRGGVAVTLWWLGLASVWFGLTNAVLGPPVVSLFLHEARPGSLLRRLGVLAGLGITQSAAAWAIVANGAGLVGPGAASVAIMALSGAAGLALGQVFLAMAPRSSASRIALPLSLIAILTMGWLGAGDAAGPPAFGTRAAAAGLLPARWAFEGLLVLEADRRPGRGPDLAEASFPSGSARMGPVADALALALLAVGLAAAAALTSRASRPPA